MIELSSFHITTINAWLTKHIDTRFLKQEDNCILLNTPLVIEFPETIYQQKIKPLYVNNQEKGGLILCSITQEDGVNKIKAEKIVEIKNVYETTAEEPSRSKANAYLPCWDDYIALLEENFSSQNVENILFPIHFHTHPTIDKKQEMEYYNSYTHLNTSTADQNVAQKRFLKFKNIHFRYLNAIITGHEDTHNILIYAPGVTPLDFVKVKSDRINNSFEKGGESLATLTDNEDGKVALKRLSQLGGLLFRAYFRNHLDYMSHLFGESEYFTTLNKSTPTIIQIPQIDEYGKIISIPKKEKSFKLKIKSEAVKK